MSKLARKIGIFDDYEEDFELRLDLTSAEISAPILCPMKETNLQLAEVEVLDPEVGKIRVSIKNSQFKNVDNMDVYVLVNVFKASKSFSPISLWITTEK